MANKFKDKTMREQYDVAVRIFNAKHRDLFYPDGSRCKGSSLAEMFWKGYEGVWQEANGKPNTGVWDRESRKTLGYAYWRAGQDMKLTEKG